MGEIHALQCEGCIMFSIVDERMYMSLCGYKWIGSDRRG